MNIEECNRHGYDHRNQSDPDYKSSDQEERAAEFREDTHHQTHIAAESKDIRKSLRQLVEISHLVNAMNKKQYTKEHSEAQYQKGNSLPSKTLWKQEIVKHSE